jgi:hypothetical protein
MAPRPIEPAYNGAIETRIDTLVLFDSCLAYRTSSATFGLYSGGMEARIGNVYVFLHDPGPAGTGIWDEDWGIKSWEDGQSWEYAGKDDDYGFRHFKVRDMETGLRKKTWAEVYRQQSCFLLAYYNDAERVNSNQRPLSANINILNYVYEVEISIHHAGLSLADSFCYAIFLALRV